MTQLNRKGPMLRGAFGPDNVGANLQGQNPYTVNIPYTGISRQGAWGDLAKQARHKAEIARIRQDPRQAKHEQILSAVQTKLANLTK